MSPQADLVGRVLRLPAPPQAPAGSEGSVRRFGPAAGYYRLRLLRWAGTQVSSAIGLFLAFGWSLVPFLARLYEGIQLGPFSLAGLLQTRWFQVLEILGLGGFLLQLPFSFLMVGLDYRARWYLLTDRSLRIREGLTTVREQTMSFANIQNVTVRRGPLQRLFGIADLQVRSAGGGDGGGDEDAVGSSKKLHLAYFRGVDNADEIRDLVLRHLKRLRSAGTGDPDDEDPSADGASVGPRPRFEQAVAALAREAKALRGSVAGSG